MPALEILPADYWRYYLMANAPESSDSNFTWEHFAGQVNKDLADVLGNFVNRVTKFCGARFEGKVPSEGAYGDEEKSLIACQPIQHRGGFALQRNMIGLVGDAQSTEITDVLSESQPAVDIEAR